MKKFITLITLVSLATTMNAQSIERWVITSCSGATICGSNIYTEFSVGEPVVSSLFSPGLVLTQGFQQPISILLITGQETQGPDLSMSVYPNPASDRLNLSMAEAPTGTYTITLQDISGCVVRSFEVETNPQGAINLDIDVQTLSGGPYLLSITDDKAIIRTYNTIIRH